MSRFPVAGALPESCIPPQGAGADSLPSARAAFSPEDAMPTKAIAGSSATGGGLGVGWALSVLIVALWWPNASTDVVQAITVLCSAAVTIPATFAAIYFAPHTP
jgi:hypothetical protein